MNFVSKARRKGRSRDRGAFLCFQAILRLGFGFLLIIVIMTSGVQGSVSL